MKQSPHRGHSATPQSYISRDGSIVSFVSQKKLSCQRPLIFIASPDVQSSPRPHHPHIQPTCGRPPGIIDGRSSLKKFLDPTCSWREEGRHGPFAPMRSNPRIWLVLILTAINHISRNHGYVLSGCDPYARDIYNAVQEFVGSAESGTSIVHQFGGQVIDWTGLLDTLYPGISTPQGSQYRGSPYRGPGNEAGYDVLRGSSSLSCFFSLSRRYPLLDMSSTGQCSKLCADWMVR